MNAQSKVKDLEYNRDEVKRKRLSMVQMDIFIKIIQYNSFPLIYWEDILNYSFIELQVLKLKGKLKNNLLRTTASRQEMYHTPSPHTC